MDDCIFCKIIKGELPSYKIYEDKFTYAFLDISNDGNGHILVVPKHHCENILDAREEDLENVIKTIQKISKHLIQNCGFDGVNILNASGKSAEQSVFHLHFHILPRKDKDGLKVFPSLTKNPKSLEDIQKSLKHKMEKTEVVPINMAKQEKTYILMFQ